MESRKPREYIQEGMRRHISGACDMEQRACLELLASHVRGPLTRNGVAILLHQVLGELAKSGVITPERKEAIEKEENSILDTIFGTTAPVALASS